VLKNHQTKQLNYPTQKKRRNKYKQTNTTTATTT